MKTFLYKKWTLSQQDQDLTALTNDYEKTLPDIKDKLKSTDNHVTANKESIVDIEKFIEAHLWLLP